jgi:hypothetical protein
LALLVAWFFGAPANAVAFFLMVPLAGLGALYWFGRPHPRRLAVALAMGLPLLIITLSGIEPIFRVSQRFDDGNLGARLVEGNGVRLIWAPDGPGWPRAGADWYGAQRVCSHLGEDGLSLAPTPQQIWRLPSVDEAVRSMVRHGHNSGGRWEPTAATVTYVTTPDKESPLWNLHSQVIYWWTATEAGPGQAFIIAYDGKVWPRSRDLVLPSQGFRCVRQP